MAGADSREAGEAGGVACAFTKWLVDARHTQTMTTMTIPRVYVDFLRTDDVGRILLVKNGTLQDLERYGIKLQEGLVLSVYSDDADDAGNRDNLVTEGVVHYDAATARWVLEIVGNSVKHESDLSTSE